MAAVLPGKGFLGSVLPVKLPVFLLVVLPGKRGVKIVRGGGYLGG